jgi:hypothetical protein
MPVKSKRSPAFVVPDEVVSRLATLAHIPKESREQFGERLRSGIALAHTANEVRRLPHGPGSDVARFLRRVKTTAQHLDQVIAMLQGKGVATDQRMAAEAAGVWLDQELDASFVARQDTSNVQPWLAEFRQLGALPWLTEYRRWLARLIETSSTTEQRATDLFPTRRGRRRGTGNTAFDGFVSNLREAVQKSGGHLTHGRDAYANKQAWKSTLLQALEILRPHLPTAGFFPAGNLGYALERLSKQFRADTAKMPSAS